MKDEVFIIMQIGDEQLDSVYEEAFEPAVTAAGFAPRRVDRHNSGDLLKSEIVQFIERSQVIVADVTNERPNCYLEIGYAMGLGKKPNLILTAREDHHHGSPNFDRNGPKVHFDLEGYDILFWDPEDLQKLRDDLQARISRRAAIVGSTTGEQSGGRTDEAWFQELRRRAEAGIDESGLPGYMEVVSTLSPVGDWSQQRLLETLRDAQIQTFGWPIGPVFDNRDAYRPHPTADGVVAEIATESQESYDYWKLFRDGRFYTLLSLFEDARAHSVLYFDTRINRVTEALLMLTRLYRRLEVSDSDRIWIKFRHSGLAGRELRAANSNRILFPGRNSVEDVVETELSMTLSELENGLAKYVQMVVEPLFSVFDFFEVSSEILEEIVDGFVGGTVK